MIRRFSEVRTRPSRALQIYSLLTAAARARRILTYGHVAEAIKFGGAGVLSEMLGHLMFWCEHNDLPALTALVVNQDTGLPGDGLDWIGDLNVEREAVFTFDWCDIYPPTEGELESAYAKGANVSPPSRPARKPTRRPAHEGQ